MSDHEKQSDHNASTASNDNNKHSSDWAEFLAQRQKRKQLIKQKKANVDKQKLSLSCHPCITSRILHKSSSYSPTSSPSSPSSSSSTSTSTELSLSSSSSSSSTITTTTKTITTKTKWIDLYEDVIYHISSFCNLFELFHIMLCCKLWNKCISYNDSSKWRLWYNAINEEIKNISSLDRTGISNHFIITQNSYDSYDSVYHFKKISKFSCYLLEFVDDENINFKNGDKLLYSSLIKINIHSKSVINLFIDNLYKNIYSEYKDKRGDSEKEGSLSLANPELIYINSYDTASDTETDKETDKEIDDDDDEDRIIIIDDNEYNHNDNDIILIRNNIKNIVKIYKYLIFCIKNNDYLKLLYLFENIILIESRPILRWFLFITDRSQCFDKKEIKLNKKNIGDITIFLKYLENYIREIHNVININKINLSHNNNNDKSLKYLSDHQQYLLKMCVDIDEIRARGISSLQYWMKSGTMICNPDL